MQHETAYGLMRRKALHTSSLRPNDWVVSTCTSGKKKYKYRRSVYFLCLEISLLFAKPTTSLKWAPLIPRSPFVWPVWYDSDCVVFDWHPLWYKNSQQDWTAATQPICHQPPGPSISAGIGCWQCYQDLSSWCGALPLHINGSVITRMYFLESITHKRPIHHYNDAIMSAMASQITIHVSGADQRKHQSSASLAFVEFTGDLWIPAQRASNAENVSIWWRHHENCWCVVPHAFIKYIWHVSNCISFKSFNATAPEIEIHAQNKWLLILWVI